MMARPTRHRGKRPALPESVGDESVPTLPAWKAFAVQFSRESGVCPEVFSGRVEHLNSGRRARFGSRQELLAVLERLLAEVEKSST